MIRTKVIGIGSPFGSDQAGWKAIEYLEQAPHSDDLQLITLDRPGAALVDHFRDTPQVILIDAIKGQAEIGSISEIDLANIDSNDLSLSTHGFGVIEAIQLATALDCLPSKLSILGIETNGLEDACLPTRKLETLLDIIIRLNS